MRAFQVEPSALFQRPEGVPEDNRTEIISPANEQYKDRKRALRAFQLRFARSSSLRLFLMV